MTDFHATMPAQGSDSSQVCISTSFHRSHFSPPDHGKPQTPAGEAPLCQSPTPQRCCGDAHPGTARPEPCPALNHIPLVRNTSGTFQLGQKPAQGCSGYHTIRASPHFSWGTVAGSQLPGWCTHPYRKYDLVEEQKRISSIKLPKTSGIQLPLPNVCEYIQCMLMHAVQMSLCLCLQDKSLLRSLMYSRHPPRSENYKLDFPRSLKWR